MLSKLLKFLHGFLQRVGPHDPNQQPYKSEPSSVPGCADRNGNNVIEPPTEVQSFWSLILTLTQFIHEYCSRTPVSGFLNSCILWCLFLFVLFFHLYLFQSTPGIYFPSYCWTLKPDKHICSQLIISLSFKRKYCEVLGLLNTVKLWQNFFFFFLNLNQHHLSRMRYRQCVNSPGFANWLFCRSLDMADTISDLHSSVDCRQAAYAMRNVLISW